MSVFQQAHEEQQYNLFLLEQHQLAEGLIYGERPSEKVVATMAAANPNFVRSSRRSTSPRMLNAPLAT